MKNSKKKLSLNKKTVFNLNNESMKTVKGGAAIITGGCTDGCTGSNFLCTRWNCTRQTCTADCMDDVLS